MYDKRGLQPEIAMLKRQYSTRMAKNMYVNRETIRKN